MKTIQALAERVRRPVRVLQFGEGNFLRAFSDCMIDIANEKGIFDGSIAVVKPKPTGSLERFRRQDCMYTVVFRGRRNGETVDSARIVTSIDAVYHPLEDNDAWKALAALHTLQFIFSNTTEAGIVLDRNDHFDGLPESFPGKLTKFLYARYEAFRGSAAAGVTLLPAELIDRNGAVLRECVLTLSELWNLPEDFRDWLKNACTFCCTLVDRIVTGFPKDDPTALYEKLGYRDELADIAEPFGLWVIEGGEGLRERLPLQQAGLPVIFTDDQRPYRERKVRVLNGAHTAMVLAGYLCGFDIVRDCMHDAHMGALVRRVVTQEIAPFVPLPLEQTLDFAASVFERFENPFLDHALLSISLNSVSKWRARVLPSFRDNFAANGRLPRLLTFSFAALLAFYRSTDLRADGLHAHRADGTAYLVRDDEAALRVFAAHAGESNSDYAAAIASDTALWGEDLTCYENFVQTVADWAGMLRADPQAALARALED